MLCLDSNYNDFVSCPTGTVASNSSAGGLCGVLDDGARRLMSRGLAPSTRRSYRVGQEHFLRLCNLLQVPAVPASGDVLLQFAAFMSRSVGHGAVHLYLAAVRMLHMRALRAGPLASRPRLSLLLLGVQRVRGSGHTGPARLPITGRILRALKRVICRSRILSDRDRLMIWAACGTACFGFVSVSEVVSPAVCQCDSLRTMLGNDITFHSGCAFLNLKASKTDTGQKGCVVVLASTGQPVCPVGALGSCMQVGQAVLGRPLFAWQDGQYLTREAFTTQLRTLLLQLGLPVDRFARHRFRIGAAASAANGAISASVIQSMGRWSSEAFRRYLCADVPAFRRVAAALARGWHCVGTGVRVPGG